MPVAAAIASQLGSSLPFRFERSVTINFSSLALKFSTIWPSEAGFLLGVAGIF